MKKSHFLTIAFAALAMVSCGNKNDNANNTEDSTTVEDSTIVSGVSKELQPTVEALISNFNQNVDKNDANALATTLADMQVVYKHLVDEGKLEEAKTYGQAIQKYVSEHANELKAMAEGNNNIPSFVEGVKNLPVSAETTIEEAKQAVMSTVVSKASPEIAKIQEAGKKVMPQHRIQQYLIISYKHAEVLFCMLFYVQPIAQFLNHFSTPKGGNLFIIPLSLQHQQLFR